MDRERKILYDPIYIWNPSKKPKLIETKNRLVISRDSGWGGGAGAVGIGKDDQIR